MLRATLVLVLPVLAAAADVSGWWNMKLIRSGEEIASARIELKAEGSKISGTLNELKLAGDVQGDRIHLMATRPDGNEWGKFEGAVAGEEMSGTVKRGKEEL